MSVQPCSASSPIMPSQLAKDGGVTRRLYLRVRHKRERDEQEGHRVGCTTPPYPTRHVRVRWEEGLGPMPMTLQRVSRGNNALLFRRLAAPATAASVVVGSEVDATAVQTTKTQVPLQASLAAAAQEQPLLLHGMRQTGNCVVLECCDGGMTADADKAQEEWFVLDHTEDDAPDAAACVTDVEDEFDFTQLTLSDTPREAVSRTTMMTRKAKRQREPAGEVLPLYHLRPLRRTECGTNSDDYHDSPAVSAFLSPMRNAAAAAVTEAATQDEESGEALLRLLRRFDPDFDAYFVNEDARAAHEAQAELYLYPDHRKDDEYDSNAEDCSNNEYPDDETDRAGSHLGSRDADDEIDVESAWRRGMWRRGQHDRTAGCYCEDGYSERALSSGWSSDEG